MPAYLKQFAEIPTYADPTAQGQTCRDIMPSGIVPGLSIGYNILDGPGHVGLMHHTWDQVFVIIKGNGTMILGDELISLKPEMTVWIPAGTDHDTLVEAGGHIEYVYVNRFPG